MKLLVVEDEQHVRERIAEGIEWPLYEIELAAAAASAKEALAVLTKEHIDIILTDIQMPLMNGLELAKRIKEEWSHIKTIILTGHDNFEYARTGIDYGVFGFLVKPAENEEIVAKVLEAAQVRHRELAEKLSVSALERAWQVQLPHLQELTLKGWLNGRFAEWELQRRSREFQLELEDKAFIPVVLDMDPIAEDNPRFHATDRALVQFSLYTIAREVLETSNCYVLQDDDGMTAAVFFAGSAEEEMSFYAQVNQQVNMLLSTVKDCLKLTASAGIGPCASDKTRVPSAYLMSRMALQERLLLGNESILTYRQDSSVRDAWATLNDLEKDFELAIETSNEARQEELIQEVMVQGFAAGKSVSEAKEMVLRMMCMFARIVISHGWTMRDTLQEDYEAFEHFYELLARDQIQEWLRRMARRISGTIAQRRRSGTQLSIGEIIVFIKERLHEEDLNLYLVAESMYINYSYLSRIFKETMGESFSDYVLRLRMEQAKELLASGMKVYDAAERVGYKHVNYFSKSFQKFWGVKPSDVYK